MAPSWGFAVAVAHVGQKLVVDLQGGLIVFQKFDHVRGLFGQLLVNDDVAFDRRVGTGRGRLEGGLVVRRLLQLGHVQLSQDPCRRPIVPEPWFPAFVGGLHAGGQGRAGAGLHDVVVFPQPVGVELLVIDDLAGPAGNAAVKSALGRIFRVLEQLPVFGQVRHRLQVRSHGFDAPFGVALDHVGRHIPPLDTVGEIRAQVNEPLVGVGVLALGEPLVIKLLPVFGPGLHVDIGHFTALGGDQGRVEHDRLPGGVADRIAQPVLDNETGDPVVDLGAVPSEIGKDDRLFRFGSGRP